MDKYLEDCLNGQEPGKYIFPFFWQHGETHEILLEEIEAIQRSGIKEFCVESRVHEKFCETNWWTDMEFILKEAGKRNMRVWLLDDKKFPTGYANGWIHKHPELKKGFTQAGIYGRTGAFGRVRASCKPTEGRRKLCFHFGMEEEGGSRSFFHPADRFTSVF